MDVVRSRMTNRAFAPCEIPRAHVEMILEAARHAPSGANAQPWHYVVVTDAAVKQAMNERGVVPNAYSITASTSPEETAAPSLTFSVVTLPARCAAISFSIFIASITQIRSPSATSSPSETATFSTVPCSGEGSVSLEALGPEPPERSRRGGRRPPACADPAEGTAAGASPITLTSKSLPETSTL